MNKKIKKMLSEAPINVKWRNIYEWVSEKPKNLLEYVESDDIKIRIDRKFGQGHYVVRWDYGTMTIKLRTSTSSLVRSLYVLVAQKCLYLGDKTTIKTGYKNWSL